MADDLLHRIVQLAGNHARILGVAEQALTTERSNARIEFTRLISAAKTIRQQKGKTWTGATFQIFEPTDRPNYDAEGGKLSAVAFNATFGGEDPRNSFGLMVEIVLDGTRATRKWTGAASGLNDTESLDGLTPPERHARAENEFLEWLRQQKLSFVTRQDEWSER